MADLKHKNIRFRHVCNPDSLINILKTERFRPVYPSPLAGDSGINGYIEGQSFIRNQAIEGRGAELIIEWNESYKEVGNDDVSYPLPPNVLLRQGAWRAVIPCQTDRKYIKVVNFEIDEKIGLSLKEKFKLWRLRSKLKKGPIHLTLLA